jgi:tetratricopeptide (TPR) repeat protein
VLATDIAAPALEQATAGRYGKRAIRMLEDHVRERYFIAGDGAVEVGERLRALVEFRRHNLVRDPVPPAGEPLFDVVLCRNVLIYFDKPTVERVLSSLERSVSPTGLLLLGAADRLCGQSYAVRQAQPDRARRRATSRSFLAGQGARGRRRSGRHRTDERSEQSTPSIASPSVTERTQPESKPRAQPTLDKALKAADRGELELAIGIALKLLADDPLDCQAHYIRGVAEFARDDPRAALEPLRRALYIDPNLSLAAFKLARAHDALGELEPARRAYERTLRALDHSAMEETTAAERTDLQDIATACRTRLRLLTESGRSRPSSR